MIACMQVKAEYASVADFVKISVLECTSRVNGGELLLLVVVVIQVVPKVVLKPV